MGPVGNTDAVGLDDGGAAVLFVVEQPARSSAITMTPVPKIFLAFMSTLSNFTSVSNQFRGIEETLFES